MQNKTPPHSIEAERAVIGCILLNAKAVYLCMEKLEPDDFYRPNHAVIYESIKELVLESIPVDLISVTDKLNIKNKYNGTEDMRYLSEMTHIIPTVDNLNSYIDIIKQKSDLRKVIQVCYDTVTQIYEEEDVDVLSQISTKISDIITSKKTSGLTPIGECVNGAYESVAKAVENKGKIQGLTTGYRTLDIVTGGLMKDQLIIVAGRPGMGKTSLIINMAARIAKNTDKVIAFFSLEMSKEQLTKKIMYTEASIDGKRARVGAIDANDFERLANESERLARTNLVINDNPNLSIAEMIAQCSVLKMQKGLDLVMIDYLQLMHIKGYTNRVQEVSEITRSAKLMSKTLGVPVILLSQLNRATEQTKSKIPQLSQLRESGSIEQDADMVWFVHRPNYYEEEDAPEVEEVILKIAKQRMGETGNIDMNWQGKYTRFSEVSKREE